MKKQKANNSTSNWKPITQDIVKQTSQAVLVAEKCLSDVKNGNTENLSGVYLELDRHLLKVIEFVKTKDINPLAFDRLETLFKELGDIKNQLKPYLYESEYSEIKEFYGGVDFKLYTEKLLGNIEVNPMRKEYLEILVDNLHSNNSKKKKKEYKDKAAFIVGIKFANGSIYNYINKCKLEGKKVSYTKLTKEIFGEAKSSSYYPYVYETVENRNTQKNIFKRSAAKSELKELRDYLLEKQIDIYPAFAEKLKLMGIN